jgi:hypothetical protein
MILIGLTLPTPFSAAAQNDDAKNATHSQRWTGNIGITTNQEGLWTLVTVASQTQGDPLQAAFVLQHDTPVPPPLNVNAKGTVELLGDPPTRSQLAVSIRTKNGCTFFRLGDYQGHVPNGCSVVDLAGIAKYDRTPTQNSLPSTHQEFVNQVLPSLEKEGPHLTPDKSTLDDCTGCISGGEGSSSCTSAPPPGSPASSTFKQLVKLADCQVTCRTGYYSCCNLNCICCKVTQSPGTGTALQSKHDASQPCKGTPVSRAASTIKPTSSAPSSKPLTNR